MVRGPAAEGTPSPGCRYYHQTSLILPRAAVVGQSAESCCRRTRRRKDAGAGPLQRRCHQTAAAPPPGSFAREPRSEDRRRKERRRRAAAEALLSSNRHFVARRPVVREPRPEGCPGPPAAVEGPAPKRPAAGGDAAAGPPQGRSFRRRSSAGRLPFGGRWRAAALPPAVASGRGLILLTSQASTQS